MMYLRKWFTYFVLGCLTGLVLGLILGWVWFFFRLIILGYGDSGPSWINIVSDYLFWGGFFLGIIGGQILFYIERKEEKKRERGRGGPLSY
jgi:hypothetical protein